METAMGLAFPTVSPKKFPPGCDAIETMDPERSTI
jgi:hypothetical protein